MCLDANPCMSVDMLIKIILVNSFINFRMSYIFKLFWYIHHFLHIFKSLRTLFAIDLNHAYILQDFFIYLYFAETC